MNTFQKWKQAMKNTPPERLMKINMQGHLLQSIGILVVCFILIYTRSMWWLIFIFVFALWNNYSGFISNYQQYNNIKELRKELNLKVPLIKSPHIKKVMLIKNKFGWKAGFISAISSVTISLLIINPLSSVWYYKLFYLITIPLIYYFIYFIIFYKIAGG